MKLSKLLSFALVALTTIIASAPVLAHNLAKYTNVPFVLPGFCGSATAKWVNVNRGMVIQITNPTGDDDVGFQIFNTVPTSNVGLPSAATGFIPTGTYTLQVSNTTPNTVGAIIFAISSAGSATPVFSAGPITNGPITFIIPSGTVAVSGYFGGPGSIGTVNLSNFTQNNQTVLGDTTQSATSTSNSPFGFCTF